MQIIKMRIIKCIRYNLMYVYTLCIIYKIFAHVMPKSCYQHVGNVRQKGLYGT